MNDTTPSRKRRLAGIPATSPAKRFDASLAKGGGSLFTSFQPREHEPHDPFAFPSSPVLHQPLIDRINALKSTATHVSAEHDGSESTRSHSRSISTPSLAPPATHAPSATEKERASAAMPPQPPLGLHANPGRADGEKVDEDDYDDDDDDDDDDENGTVKWKHAPVVLPSICDSPSTPTAPAAPQSSLSASLFQQQYFAKLHDAHDTLDAADASKSNQHHHRHHHHHHQQQQQQQSSASFSVNSLTTPILSRQLRPTPVLSPKSGKPSELEAMILLLHSVDHVRQSKPRPGGTLPQDFESPCSYPSQSASSCSPERLVLPVLDNTPSMSRVAKPDAPSGMGARSSQLPLLLPDAASQLSEDSLIDIWLDPQSSATGSHSKRRTPSRKSKSKLRSGGAGQETDAAGETSGASGTLGPASLGRRHSQKSSSKRTRTRSFACISDEAFVQTAKKLLEQSQSQGEVPPADAQKEPSKLPSLAAQVSVDGALPTSHTASLEDEFDDVDDDFFALTPEVVSLLDQADSLSQSYKKEEGTSGKPTKSVNSTSSVLVAAVPSPSALPTLPTLPKVAATSLLPSVPKPVAASTALRSTPPVTYRPTGTCSFRPAAPAPPVKLQTSAPAAPQQSRFPPLANGHTGASVSGGSSQPSSSPPLSTSTAVSKPCSQEEIERKRNEAKRRLSMKRALSQVSAGSSSQLKSSA